MTSIIYVGRMSNKRIIHPLAEMYYVLKICVKDGHFLPEAFHHR